MWVPVTDFGFVRPAIARDLVATIARAAERYAAPRVVLSGGAALVDEDDRFVWVELKADDDSVEVMRGISREVVAVVEPLGFYCDRRQFRSRIPLAAVNDLTTVEHLEIVIAAARHARQRDVDGRRDVDPAARRRHVSPGGHRSRARGLIASVGRAGLEPATHGLSGLHLVR